MLFDFRFLLIPSLILSLILRISANAIAQPSNPVANRIIALTSISADILQQLDRQKLVGMSGSSLFDQDSRFANIPKVSSGRTPPNLERIIALKPDLVIGAVGFHDQALKRLQSLGISTISSSLNSWSDLEKLIQQLAQATQTSPMPVMNSLQTCAPTNPKSNLSTLVLASRQPLLSPNRQSWAGSLLDRFNFKNTTAELQGQSPIRRYVTLSPERLLQANPTNIILIDVQGGDIAEIKQLPFWNQLQATRNNRVFTFDYYGLVNPGSLAKIGQACTKLKSIGNL